jgi:hypothetical protein
MIVGSFGPSSVCIQSSQINRGHQLEGLISAMVMSHLHPIDRQFVTGLTLDLQAVKVQVEEES